MRGVYAGISNIKFGEPKIETDLFWSLVRFHKRWFVMEMFRSNPKRIS